MRSEPSHFDREEREVEYARVLAFSDGVFAFAVTLLVTTIDVPDLSGPDLQHQLLHRLDDLLPSLFGYFLSFAVIGLMWMHHHRLFSRIRRIDGGTLWLNLLALSFIVLMPFSTEMIGRYGDVPLAVAIYALNLALATLSYTLVWWYCTSRDLLGERLGAQQLRTELWTRLWISFGFLASIPLAFLSTTLAELSWLAAGLSQARVARLMAGRGRPRRDVDGN